MGCHWSSEALKLMNSLSEKRPICDEHRAAMFVYFAPAIHIRAYGKEGIRNTESGTGT